RLRRPSTNSTRLTPYDRNPVTIATVTDEAAGTLAWVSSARPRFADPATRPLTAAICMGSARERDRVTLLSIPHATHAPATNSAPASGRTEPPLHESSTAPARMAKAPSSRR